MGSKALYRASALLLLALVCATARPLHNPPGRALLSTETREFIPLPKGYNCEGEKLRDAIRNVDSLDDCQEQCELYSECRAATWNSETRKCFLKRSCSPEAKSDNWSVTLPVSNSYVDIPKGWGCQGEDSDNNLLDEPIEDIRSLSQCKERCNENNMCFAVTWNNDKETCYLKSGCTRYDEKDDNESAVASSSPYFDIPKGWGCLGHDSNNNILDEPIEDIRSLSECKERCDDNNMCSAVTWNNDKETCYLKSGCSWYEEKDDNESAVKAEGELVVLPGEYNCEGDILGDAITGVDSLDDCMEECEDDSRCFAVTWNDETRKCYRKRACDGVEEKDNNFAAIRN